MSDPKAKTVEEVKVEQPKDLNQVLKPKEQEIELSFGKFIVKDLSLMDVIVLVSKYADILNIVASAAAENEIDLKEITSSDMLSMLASIGDVRTRLSFFLALCCGVENESYLFENPKDEDLETLLMAIIEVIDFNRIQTTFLESKLLKKIQKVQTSLVAE